MLSRNSTIVVKRGAASAFATKSETTPSSREVKVSRLQNGLTVASVDTGAAVSRLAVAFRAGARYESADEQGLTHHLRNAVGQDSLGYTGIQLLWETGSVGANLTSNTTRDLFTVEVDVHRDLASRALSVIGEMAAQPAFKPWELKDHTETIWADLSFLKEQPHDLVLDLLHEAAYRNGPMANSLYTKDFMVGKFQHKHMAQFAASRLVSGEGAIVGVNVDHGDLLSYATDEAPVVSGQGAPAVPSKYLGGQVRQSGPGELAYVAVAGQGVGLSDSKGCAVQAVLASVLGVGPSVKYSNGAGNGVASLAVHKASDGYPYAMTALSPIHADAGLVGIQLVSHGDRVGAMLIPAVNAFRELAKTPVDSQALQRAKRMTAMNALLRAEDSSELATDLTAQTLATGSFNSPAEFAKLVESVTAAEVQQAASKAVAKLSMAAYGNLRATPYLDEL